MKTLPTEKIRILRERGLFKEELAKVSARYNVRTAVTNICDFVAIRKATLEVVNFTKRHSENAKE